MKEYEGRQIWCAVLPKNKIPECQKKVFNASLTELTHSFWEHDSLLKAPSCVQAVGGQLAHRNVSVMLYIAQSPLASLGDMKAGPGRHAEAVCRHEGGSEHARALLVGVELRSELHFNLKHAYQTEDVGQPVTQRDKYPRLESNQVYRWCTLQAEELLFF